MNARTALVLAAVMPAPLGLGCVGAEDRWPERQEALAILAETEVFAGPRVGYAGHISDQVHAFQRVLSEPGAAELFRELREEATLAGQLYALAGLSLTDPAELDRQVGPYLASDEEVDTFRGCIMGSLSVASIAAEILEGELPRELRDVADDR